MQSGDLLVEVSSASQSQTLSNCKEIGSFSVSVQAHPTLNTIRGVISAADLLHSTKEELLENLKDQDVVDVRRITIRRNEQVLPTKHIILTFNSSTLPTRIKAAYLSCAVRPYIPNPLRCFQCQRFGHSKNSCRGSITCARCAEVGHDDKSCEKPEHCANCKGNHTAYSRSCPNWVREKEVTAVKTTQKLSYPEARRIVENRTPSVGVSYSSILKQPSKSVRHISTQTPLIETNTYVTSTPTAKKEFRDAYAMCVQTNMPHLKLLPPSSKPVTRVPYDPAKHDPIRPKSLVSKSKTPSQSSLSQNSRVTIPAQQSKTKSVSTKNKPSSSSPTQLKNVKKKQKRSSQNSVLPNTKNTRQLIHYAADAMESEPYNNDSDSNEDNVVFQDYEPT